MNDEYGHRLKAFSLRMEKELRKKLEDQAKANGRTLTSEINYRLDQSLEVQAKESNQDKVLNELGEIKLILMDKKAA